MAIIPTSFSQPLIILASIAISLASINAQAVLPKTIQLALERAQLNDKDISILVTAVGNSKMSRLPAHIQMLDTSSSSFSSTAADTKVATTSDQQTPSLTVDKSELEQRERQLAAYTDDPYLYQSLESPPPILSIYENTVIRRHNNDANSLDQNSVVNDQASLTTPTLTTLISHYPTSARTPASTMKLIPSFIALDTLRADFIWFTRVYYTGIIVDKRLQGDLIIQASGDPKMTHERLEQLLYKVREAGIRHIDGDIIIDSSIFQNVSKDPADFDNAPLRPYNASPDGFLVNFNSLAIKSHLINNEQATLAYEPQLANYQLPEVIDTRSGTCQQASQSLAPQWQSNELTFNNLLPQSCGEHIFYINYPDAKEFAARVVANKWQTLGNTLSGTVIAQESPYQVDRMTRTARSFRSTVSTMPLVSYPSLSLAQQLYDINHFSNNVMTEQVTLSIGSYGKAYHSDHSDNRTSNNKTQDNQAATALDNMNTVKNSLYQFSSPKTTDYPQALASIQQWWQNNLTTPPPYLTNGSGLCRQCTLTAANLDELLGFAYRHPNFDTYVQSLGIAGVSGTIAYHSERAPDSAAIGRAWIKTGTLNNVSAIAGYVSGQSGQDYTVVGLINTEHAINPDDARPVLDALLDWTAQQ